MPDPVSAGFAAAEEAAWYARLPTMFAAAAALFTGSGGRVLIISGRWPPRCAPGTPGRPPTCRGPSHEPDPQLARDAGPDLTWS